VPLEAVEDEAPDVAASSETAVAVAADAEDVDEVSMSDVVLPPARAVDAIRAATIKAQQRIIFCIFIPFFTFIF